MNTQVEARPEDRNGEMGALLCAGDWKCWVSLEDLRRLFVCTKQALADKRLEEQERVR